MTFLRVSILKMASLAVAFFICATAAAADKNSVATILNQSVLINDEWEKVLLQVESGKKTFPQFDAFVSSNLLPRCSRLLDKVDALLPKARLQDKEDLMSIRAVLVETRDEIQNTMKKAMARHKKPKTNRQPAQKRK